MKRAKSGKARWASRYFRLFSHSLKYYSRKSDTVPRGEMTLTVEHYVTDLKSRKEKQANVFIIDDLVLKYYLAAESPALRDYWMHAIARIIRNLQQKENWFGEADGVNGLNRVRTPEEVERDLAARLEAYKKSSGHVPDISSGGRDSVVDSAAQDNAAAEKKLAIKRMEAAIRANEEDMLKQLEQKRVEAAKRLLIAEENDRIARAAVEHAEALALEAAKQSKKAKEKEKARAKKKQSKKEKAKQQALEALAKEKAEAEAKAEEERKAKAAKKLAKKEKETQKLAADLERIKQQQAEVERKMAEEKAAIELRKQKEAELKRKESLERKALKAKLAEEEKEKAALEIKQAAEAAAAAAQVVAAEAARAQADASTKEAAAADAAAEAEAATRIAEKAAQDETNELEVLAAREEAAVAAAAAAEAARAEVDAATEAELISLEAAEAAVEAVEAAASQSEADAQAEIDALEAAAASAQGEDSSKSNEKPSLLQRLSKRLSIGRAAEPAPAPTPVPAPTPAPTPKVTKPVAEPAPAEPEVSVTQQATKVMSGIASRLMAWNQKIEEREEKQASNVFSAKHDASKTAAIDKNSANYGKAAAGSKSDLRAQQAATWVEKEVEKLIGEIKKIGYVDEDGNQCVKFGPLFVHYQDISDTLVGILMRAKKRKLLQYKGDMLFQGMNDDTVITLL